MLSFWRHSTPWIAICAFVKYYYGITVQKSKQNAVTAGNSGGGGSWPLRKLLVHNLLLSLHVDNNRFCQWSTPFSICHTIRYILKWQQYCSLLVYIYSPILNVRNDEYINFNIFRKQHLKIYRFLTDSAEVWWMVKIPPGQQWQSSCRAPQNQNGGVKCDPKSLSDKNSRLRRDHLLTTG